MATSSIKRLFGRVVRKRRQAAGISQEDLAYEAHVHRTYVSMVERGIANPSLTVVEGLAAALGTTLASIFREVEAG